MVECVAFGDLFAQMGNYLSIFLFSFKFIAFSSLLHLIIEHNDLPSDLFGLFCACYLLLATTPVSGSLQKDHGIDLN